MRKIKKNRGIDALKNRYGLMFIAPWLFGFVMFVAYPLVQSIIYSFSKITILPGKVDIEFIGIDNYKEVLMTNAEYEKWLNSSVTAIFYSLPIILILSLVLAIMLNQKFRGRLFFRALYFLPVIIATGQVINFLFNVSEKNMTEMGVSDSYSANMISVNDIVGWLNLDSKTAGYITNTVSRILDLVWSCGIQIVLFLAGLQSVPTSLYEVSKVEGATKWEEFWFITLPMISRVILLVGIFTMVEIITNERSSMIQNVFGQMKSGVYDISSAMIWIYFLICGAIMGVIIFLYTRFLMKRWDS